MKRLLILCGLVLLGVGFAFANGSSEKSGSAPAMSSGGKVGGSATLMATWTGDEQNVLMSMLKPFEDKTGIKVNYTGTRDLIAVVTTRVAAGNPPDLAAFPNPGQMIQLANQGKLKPLDAVLDMSTIKQQYSPGWLDRGTVNGKLYGIFTKAAAKGFIWYDVQAAQSAGITPPTTWQGMLDLSNKIAASGVAPWAIGVESGAASGWVGTDWLESIFLKKYGPVEYEKWYKGQIPWTSDEVKSVWQDWGKIVGNPKMIYGGPQYVLSTNFGEAFAPLFQSPPKAYLHFQATFITGFINKQFPDLKPIQNYNFFRFPEMNPQYAKSIEASGDVYTMFNDTAQSKALVNFVATPEAQQAWIASGAISPNKAVPLSAYTDPIIKQAADMMNQSDIVVFDASDSMPNQMNQAFWSAILDFIKNPGNLDSILQNLEKVRQEAYK